MARQRFIWPELWKDPVFGKLEPVEQVLFIGFFSIADDEGRLMADPAYLRAEVFPYKDWTNRKVENVRDATATKCVNVCLYEAEGLDYIALLKWHDYQKPKYPKPSKIPPPFPEDSSTAPYALPESGATGRAGLGRVGLDRAGLGSADDDLEEKKQEVRRVLRAVQGVDANSEAILMHLAEQLPIGATAKVRESCQAHPGKYVGYAVNALKDELAQRGAA